MSLKDVEAKVLASAEQEAKGIIEKAEADAKAHFERRAAALRDEQQRRIAAGKAQADTDLEREVTSRRAEHAMKLLAAKNGVLDAIFEKALASALASEGFAYAAWLDKQVAQAVAAAAGVLHCNERDRAAVEAALAAAHTDQVTLAAENAAIQGGVLLVGETFDLDLTLEAALADLREDLIVSLAKRLFAAVPPIGDPLAAGDAT